MKKKNKKLSLNYIDLYNFIEGKFKIIYKAPRKNYDALGLCIHPNKFPNKTDIIYIDPNLKQRKFLKVIIDELIHANCWPLDNIHVDIMSDNIANFLWELGFRLKDK